MNTKIKKGLSILMMPIIMGIVSLTPQTVSATIITDFEAFSTSSYNGTVLFRQPSFSGSTSAMLESSPDYSKIVKDGTGGNTTNMLKTSFAWDQEATNPWLRLTTYKMNTLPNPQVDINQWLYFDIFSAKAVNLFGVGIRDTNTSGPIASDGGVGGNGIVWLSNSELGAYPNPVSGGASIASGIWHTISLNLSDAPFTRPFVLNPDLTGDSFGVLEHLAFTPYNGLLGSIDDPHMIYLDNFRQGPAPTVPEPTTLALMGLGLAGLGFIRRRQSNS